MVYFIDMRGFEDGLPRCARNDEICFDRNGGVCVIASRRRGNPCWSEDDLPLSCLDDAQRWISALRSQ